MKWLDFNSRIVVSCCFCVFCLVAPAVSDFYYVTCDLFCFSLVRLFSSAHVLASVFSSFLKSGVETLLGLVYAVPMPSFEGDICAFLLCCSRCIMGPGKVARPLRIDWIAFRGNSELSTGRSPRLPAFQLLCQVCALFSRLSLSCSARLPT